MDTFSDWLDNAVAECDIVIRQTWPLIAPKNLRVEPLTRWQSYATSAPQPQRLILHAIKPLWAKRTKLIFRFAAGWHLRFWQRDVVAVKPPNSRQSHPDSVGKQLFIHQAEPDKSKHLLCHELTHAYTAHLRLPAWLNEGVAMVTVDALFGMPTVQVGTVALLQHSKSRPPRSYNKLDYTNHEMVRYAYARGYWLVRYLAAAHPTLLRQLLTKRLRKRKLNRLLARSLGLSVRKFWRRIDGVVYAHFVEEISAESPQKHSSRHINSKSNHVDSS